MKYYYDMMNSKLQIFSICFHVRIWIFEW